MDSGQENKPVPHSGRMKLPETLRREEIIIEPQVDTAGCKKMYLVGEIRSIYALSTPA
jgi:hypothetical protein